MPVVDLDKRKRHPLRSAEEVQRILQEVHFSPRLHADNFRSYISDINRAVPETPLYNYLTNDERMVLWPTILSLTALVVLALSEVSRFLPNIPDPSVVSFVALCAIALCLLWFSVLFLGLPKMREFEYYNEPRHSNVWEQLPLTKWHQDQLDEVLRQVGPGAEIQANIFHRYRRRLTWQAQLFTRGHTAYEVVLWYANNEFSLFSNHIEHQ